MLGEPSVLSKLSEARRPESHRGASKAQLVERQSIQQTNRTKVPNARDRRDTEAGKIWGTPLRPRKTCQKSVRIGVRREGPGDRFRCFAKVVDFLDKH